MTRVVAIGLDAAEPWFVDQLMAEGVMPNLARLAEGGARAQLENTGAYRAEVPWTQFATGVEPSESHYWTMVHYDPTTYQAWEHGAYDYQAHRPFWHDLDGKEAVIFDVPQVRIHDDYDGTVVTAWGSHSPQYARAAHPRGLLRDIEDRFGPHPGFEQDNEPCWYHEPYLTAMAASMETGARRRGEILAWLRQQHPADLLVSVMSETHSIEHHCFHGIDPTHAFAGVVPSSGLAARLARDVFRAVDDGIGVALRDLPADTVAVVFAVHGMRQNMGDLAGPLFAEVLHRVNFGEQLMLGPNPRVWKARGMPLVEPESRWSIHMRHRFREQGRRGVAAHLPWELLEARQRVLRRLQGKRPPERPTFPFMSIPPETDLSPADLLPDPRTSIDWQIQTWYKRYWPQMRAFVLPAYSDAHIRINLEGREKFGRVSPDDYAKACDEVEAILRACVNPRTGEPVVGEIVRVRADDPFAPDGPTADLVVMGAGTAFDAVEHPDAGLVGPYPLFRTGEHSHNGFLVANGPGIPAGADLGLRSSLDVTPTLVALLGEQPSARYAGESLFAPLRA